MNSGCDLFDDHLIQSNNISSWKKKILVFRLFYELFLNSVNLGFQIALKVSHLPSKSLICPRLHLGQMFTFRTISQPRACITQYNIPRKWFIHKIQRVVQSLPLMFLTVLVSCTAILHASHFIELANCVFLVKLN